MHSNTLRSLPLHTRKSHRRPGWLILVAVLLMMTWLTALSAFPALRVAAEGTMPNGRVTDGTVTDDLSPGGLLPDTSVTGDPPITALPETGILPDGGMMDETPGEDTGSATHGSTTQSDMTPSRTLGDLDGDGKVTGAELSAKNPADGETVTDSEAADRGSIVALILVIMAIVALVLVVIAVMPRQDRNRNGG